MVEAERQRAIEQQRAVAGALWAELRHIVFTANLSPPGKLPPDRIDPKPMWKYCCRTARFEWSGGERIDPDRGEIQSHRQRHFTARADRFRPDS
jgi:hypothetical protein